MPIARSVVITGIGFVAAAPLHEALAGTLAAPPDPPPEITAFEIPEGAPTWGFEVLDFSLEKELPNIKSFVDRTSALALGAAKFALADAGLLVAPASCRPPESRQDAGATNPEIGCAYGTALGCLEAMGIFWNKVKSSNPKFAPPLPFTHGYANSPSSLLCIEFGLRGPAATFSGENLAGMEALLFAFDQIAAGSGEIILAGASDSLTQAAWSHLYATGQLSRGEYPLGPEGDTWISEVNDTRGIVPGEGAAMLVLESDESARKRGARVYAEIQGIGFGTLTPMPPMARCTVLDSFGNRIGPPEETTIKFEDESPQAPALPDVRPFAGTMLSVTPVLATALGARLLYQPGEKSMPLSLKHCVVPVDERRAIGVAGNRENDILAIVLKKR